MPCLKPKEFLENLVEVNMRAGVAPDIIDLLESYARLRLRKKQSIDFYSLTRPVDKKDALLASFLEKNSSLDQRAKNFIVAYYQEMKEQNLLCILNNSHLAHLLQTPLEDLYFFAKVPNKNYQIFSISKSNGNQRQIQAPHQRLKQVQRKILDQILHNVPLNNHAEGFRPKRSVLTNATRHVAKKIVLKLDIKEFFPTIGYRRVRGMFQYLGYPRQVSTLLSSLTTYKKMLPTGAPTSPAIANIICKKLDSRLVNLGRKTGFSYSRYADDMTISGNEELVVKMIPFFKEIIVDEGFAINEAKLKIMRSGRRQAVTGVVVNQHPNICKPDRKVMRAILHNCRHGNILHQKEKWAKEQKGAAPFSYSVTDFKRSLLAKIHYIKMINQPAGEKLLTSFHSISWPV